jgi:hypothetical protein
MSDTESGVAKAGQLSHVDNRVPAVRREGAIVIGATALGALAIGALAIGKMAIGQLALGRAKLRRGQQGNRLNQNRGIPPEA